MKDNIENEARKRDLLRLARNRKTWIGD